MAEPDPYERQTPRSSDRSLAWGRVSIGCALAPLILSPMLLALEANPDAAAMPAVLWLPGLIVGVLGLWEKGRAKRLAFYGVLLNVFVPPVAFVLFVLFGMSQLAGAMGG